MEATEKKFFDVPGRAVRFRNFAGKAGQFNNEGERYFCLMIDDDTAETMKEEGWNVKYLKPKSPEDEPAPYIQVKVEFRKGRPPKMVQITRRGKTFIDEENVGNLDWADIEKVDVSINPSKWSLPSGRSGITAYLKKMNIFLEEDDFEDRYYDVPDSAQNIVDEEYDD